MDTILLNQEKRFLKANLHSHTTNSDGNLSPEQAKNLYVENGYNVLAITDHNVLNSFEELNDENFLTLCGYEFDVFDTISYAGFSKACHICAIAKKPLIEMELKTAIKPKDYSITAINKTLETLDSAGFLLHYNHPSWSSESEEDFLPLKHITAMEIYNHNCEITANCGDTRAYYDIALKHSHKWNCISTDDNHNEEISQDFLDYETDSFGGYIMINAQSLDYNTVISAIENGDYYSCMGVDAPQIFSLIIENNVLKITCSPVKGIYLKSNCLGCCDHKTSQYDNITSAEFDLSSLAWGGKFFRLEIVDSQKRTAFTNPIYVD